MPDKNKTVAITIRADHRRLKADMRRNIQEVKAFERQVGGVANRMKRMRMNFMQSGIFGRGGGAIRTAAGFAGVFGFQQLIMDAKNMDAALTDVAITGNLTGAKLSQLKKQMFDVAGATGKSTTEVLSFVQAMTTATGDTGAAMVALKGIGEVAVATGTDMGSLGQVFVKLTTSMKILPREARQAFNILRGQEKKGSVTMAEMGRVLPEVVGAGGILGKSATGLKGVSALGGLLQLTRRGTGSVEEAKTASARFLQAIFKNRKKIKKHLGVNVTGADGEVRDLQTVFGELGISLAKKGGLGKALSKGIFDIRSLKSATQLSLAAQVGLGNKQGTLASFNAVFGAGKDDVIGADAAKRRKSASFQFGKAMNDLKITMQKTALPAFKQLAETMKEFGPDLVKILKFMLENSKNLLKLWLGYKGATFFRNLIKAGGMGTREGASMGGGFMTNAGMVSPGTTRGMYTAPGMWGSRGGQLGGGFSGVGGWSARGGLRGRSGIRSRMGNWYGRNRAGMGRGAGIAGQGAGFLLGAGSSFFGTPGRSQFKGQDMAENIGLMSGNPYAMAAAAAMKGSRTSQMIGQAQGGFSGGALQALTGSAFSTYAGLKNFGTAQKDTVGVGGMGSATAAINRFTESLIAARVKTARWLDGTIEGEAFKRRERNVQTELGFGEAGNFVMPSGIHSAKSMPALKALRSRLQGVLSTRKRIAQANNPDAQTEAQLRGADSQYSLFSTSLDSLNRIMVAVEKRLKLPLMAVVKIDNNGVADRLLEGGNPWGDIMLGNLNKARQSK